MLDERECRIIEVLDYRRSLDLSHQIQVCIRKAPHSMAVGQYGSVVHTHKAVHFWPQRYVHTNVYTHTHFVSVAESGAGWVEFD